MNKEVNRDKYLTIFREEWRLIADEKRVPTVLEETVLAKKGIAFDRPPHTGEIRLFAGCARPILGLVVKNGKKSWKVIPVSEFSVPATDKELLVGSRVYRLWNVLTLPDDFVACGWLVEKVAEADVNTIVQAAETVSAGRELPEELSECSGLPITEQDDFRREYELSFRVTKKVFSAVHEKPKLWWRLTKYATAACLVIALGGTTLLYFANSAHNQMGVAESALVGKCMDFGSTYCEAKMSPSVDREVNHNQFQGRFSPVEPSSSPARKRIAHPQLSKEPAMQIVTIPDTERFAEYHENEFVEVLREPLSTFGLDVDTASYATMRRYLTEMKSLPPKDSVRLEEYVNYFTYDYPEPKDEHPVAVHCELGECPWAEGHRLLKVGVQAKRVPTEKLPPSNLVFLLDCSGSMSWNGGFDMLVKSMRMLVGQLRPQDHVSIVTYANGSEVVLKSTSGDEKSRILRAIDSLSCSGGTYGEGGIQLAYEEAARNFRSTSNNRVILMTDGDFNVGISDPQKLERFIGEKRSSGVFLTVLGVGRGNYQDRTMKRLANAGNGNYSFIDSLLEAKKVLMTEFGSSMYTIAKDVKLQLEFNPSQTAAYRLLGYECRQLEAKDFNDDKKDAGEMGAGHTMTAFYELIPTGAETGVAKTDALKYQKSEPVASDELLTVKLRYKEPNGDTSKLMEKPVVAADILRAEGPSEDFVFASAVAEFALVLEDSKFRGKANLAEVIKRAKRAKGADDNGYRAEFIRLAETAEALESVGR